MAAVLGGGAFAREGGQRVFALAMLASLALHAALLFADFLQRDAAGNWMWCRSRSLLAWWLRRACTPAETPSRVSSSAAGRENADRPGAVGAARGFGDSRKTRIRSAGARGVQA